jgi:hypothetical protein
LGSVEVTDEAGAIALAIKKFRVAPQPQKRLMGVLWR